MDSKYLLSIELDREQGKLLGDTLWSFTDSDTRGFFGPAAYYAVRANEAKIKGTLSIADLDVANFMLGFFLAQDWIENPPAILEPVIDRFMELFPDRLGL